MYRAVRNLWFTGEIKHIESSFKTQRIEMNSNPYGAGKNITECCMQKIKHWKDM